jgi:uncharacterized membrane protein
LSQVLPGSEYFIGNVVHHHLLFLFLLPLIVNNIMAVVVLVVAVVAGAAVVVVLLLSLYVQTNVCQYGCDQVSGADLFVRFL